MRPDGLYLPEERKQLLFEAAPDVFVQFMWGKTANVIVQIAKLSRKELEALLREAWQHATPPAKAAKPPPPNKTGTKKRPNARPLAGARRWSMMVLGRIAMTFRSPLPAGER
ncbi:MAG: hypothetical protein QOJ84_4661 [Bradyrhizobium sp.]|jgi:hypothetical protein|nr:hypothetical protein [Bradyrhizobium sp.]